MNKLYLAMILGGLFGFCIAPAFIDNVLLGVLVAFLGGFLIGRALAS